MTVRRLNYTGRQKIHRSDIDVALLTEGDSFMFDAAYRLDSYGFPLSAPVVVEATVGWAIMRFAFGTVGEPVIPASTALTDFWSAEGLRFRLKVLGDEKSAGRVLGIADNLAPTELTQPAAAKSFIAVRPTDLGPIVWQVSFDGGQPILHLNERLADWRSFIRRPPVRAMLIPEVLRQVLKEAVTNPSDEEDTGSWQTQVLALLNVRDQLPSEEDGEDEIDSWVDDLVSEFARRHRLWRGMHEFLEELED